MDKFKEHIWRAHTLSSMSLPSCWDSGIFQRVDSFDSLYLQLELELAKGVFTTLTIHFYISFKFYYCTLLKIFNSIPFAIQDEGESGKYCLKDRFLLNKINILIQSDNRTKPEV